MHSVVVVPVPAANALTAPWRAPHGMLAHVTLAAPFLTPSTIDDLVAATLAASLDGTSSFDVRFSTVAWFGRRVVYLAPDDPTPFVDLARTIGRAFPGPSAGSASPFVAHLTIAKNRTLTELRDAAASSAELLPLATRASEVALTLFDPVTSDWRERARVALA